MYNICEDRDQLLQKNKYKEVQLDCNCLELISKWCQAFAIYFFYKNYYSKYCLHKFHHTAPWYSGERYRPTLFFIAFVKCCQIFSWTCSRRQMLFDASAADDFWKHCLKFDKLIKTINSSFCHNDFNTI